MNGEKALAVNYEFKLELDKQMTLGTFTVNEFSKVQFNPLPAAKAAPEKIPAP